jgi:glycosyltransferase involved in cell wall biosynthesis
VRPKVAVLTNIPSPYQVELFNAIATQGRIDLRVWYCAARDQRRLWEAPPLRHWHRIGNGWRISTNRGDYYLDVRLAGEIAKWRPDLAVLSGYTMPAVQLAMWRAALQGIRWVYWGEAVASGGRSWPRRAVRRVGVLPIRRWAAGLFGVGRKAVANFRRVFPSARIVRNVPYFSELGRFRPPEASAVRRGGTTRFLYVGSFIERKGVDVLARAFSKLVEGLPCVELVVAGDGDARRWFDPFLSPQAAERVVRRGFMPWDQLPQLYRDGDFLVMPSRYDGWGMVVPEAMASGVPVIGSTGAGAVLDLVQPGATGWHVPPNDGEELEAALRSAATLPDAQGREMRQRCLARARRYDVGVGARVFTRAVQLVVSGKTG